MKKDAVTHKKAAEKEYQNSFISKRKQKLRKARNRGTILQRRKRHEFSPVFFHLSYVFFLSTFLREGGGNSDGFRTNQVEALPSPNSSLQSSRPDLHKDRVEGVDHQSTSIILRLVLYCTSNIYMCSSKVSYLTIFH